MANETILKLRSDKFASVKVTAPTGGYTAGLLTKVGSLVGVIVAAAVAAADATLIYRCEKIVVAKDTTSGDTFTVGAKVYYASNKVYNAATKPSGAVLCGVALEVANAAATTLEIDLDGALGIVS